MFERADEPAKVVRGQPLGQGGGADEIQEADGRSDVASLPDV